MGILSGPGDFSKTWNPLFLAAAYSPNYRAALCLLVSIKRILPFYKTLLSTAKFPRVVPSARKQATR